MTAETLRDQLLQDFEQLPLELKRRVQEYAHSLATKGKVIGTPGRELLRFAGTIDKESLREMKAAIEEGCERVDLHEW